MRRAVIVATVLLLAACNNSPNWEKEQAELANELNASTTADANVAAPAAVDANAETANDVNAASSDANDVNASAPADSNEAAPQP
jgi:hypothetical protein